MSIGTTPDGDVRLDEPLSCKRLLDLRAARGFRPDLAFWCDGCQTPWIFGIETLPAVTVTVSGGPGTSPAPPPPSGEPGNPAPTASPRAGGSGGAAGTPVTGSGPGSGGSQQRGTPARGKHVPDPQPQRGS